MNLAVFRPPMVWERGQQYTHLLGMLWCRAAPLQQGAAGCFLAVFFFALQVSVLGAQNALPQISGVGLNYYIFVEIFENLLSRIFFSQIGSIAQPR